MVSGSITTILGAICTNCEVFVPGITFMYDVQGRVVEWSVTDRPLDSVLVRGYDPVFSHPN